MQRRLWKKNKGILSKFKKPLIGEYRGFDDDFKCHYVLVGLRLYYCHADNYRFEFLNQKR